MKDYKEIAENVLKRRDEYLRIQKRKRSIVIKTVSSVLGAAAAACVSISVYNNSTVQEIKPDFSGNPYDITECTKPTSAISTEITETICTTAVTATEPSVNITTETVCTEYTDTTAVNTTETNRTSATSSQTTASSVAESVWIPVSKTTSATYEAPITSMSTLPLKTNIPEGQPTTAIQYTSLTATATVKTTNSPAFTTAVPNATTIYTHDASTGSVTLTLPYFTTVVPQTTGDTMLTTVYTTTTDIYWVTVSETTNTTTISMTFTATQTYTTTTIETTDLLTSEPVTYPTTYLYFIETTTATYYFSYDIDDVYITTYTTII